MFVTLRQVEDRSWLIPSCQGCPPPPHIHQKPTYEDLKRSAEAGGCEKCRLFVRGIDEVCSPEACAGTVRWSWNYSVLTGRRWGRGRSREEEADREDGGDDNDDTEVSYEVEFSIHADSKPLLVSDPHLPTEFHVGHPVPEGTNSEETLNQIRKWYTTCVQSHEKCRLSPSRPEEASYIPRRLLDIQSPDCESGVRLLETAEDITVSPSLSPNTGARIEYVCLSHCWGNSKPECITLHSTLASNRRGIPWSSIPRTFQDVIGVLRRLGLGLRYLWIDSICIIQDSPTDWAREAGEMCNVYSCTALTIAAANASDSGQGLFSTSPPLSLSLSPSSSSSSSFSAYHSRELEMRLNDETKSSLRVWARKPLPHFAGSETHTNREENTEKAPLLGRGWVLQERLLSRRVVHFAKNEVVWECLHGSECQCLGGGGERMYSPKVALGAFLHASAARGIESNSGSGAGYETSNPAAQWLEVVEEYTKLSLTFATDRFPALSGAAQRSRQLRSDGQRYFAGLWQREMPLGLAWCARGPLRQRSEEWIAPTWSWASVESGVWWPGKYFDIVKSYLTSFEADCVLDLEDADPTGRLKSATLTVSGGLVSEGVLLWEEDLMENNLNEMFSVQFGPRKFTGCFWPDYVFHESNGEGCVEHGSKVVWLALLDVLWPGGRTHEYTGLILRESSQAPGEFERIGRFRIEDTEGHEFIMARATERSLIIV